MKVCSWCKLEKPEEDFAFRNKSEGIRRAQCKSCIKEWDKNYWASGKKVETSRQARRRRREENEDYLWEVFNLNSCLDCGNSNPLVLTFDHLTDKKCNISSMIRDYSLDKIKQEIDKCEIVCHNCHSIRTSTRAGWWRSKRGT